MDDPAVFIDLRRNTIGVTTHQTIDAIMKLLESFRDFLAVNDGYIETFSRMPILQIMTERLRRES